MDAEHDHSHEHTIAVQRQALQQQAMELDLALKEIANAQRTYRFVGNLLVQTEPETLKADLTRKRESVQARLDSMKKKS